MGRDRGNQTKDARAPRSRAHLLHAPAVIRASGPLFQQPRRVSGQPWIRANWKFHFRRSLNRRASVHEFHVRWQAVENTTIDMGSFTCHYLYWLIRMRPPTTRRRLKRVGPNRSGVPITVYLDETLNRRLNTASKERHTGKSSIVRIAVERLLTQLESGQLDLPLGIQ